MKIKLPKDIVGVKFPRVCTIEMNDFDIDLFLPSLFFTILAQGRGRARRANDPKAIAQYIDALAHHQDLVGFDDPEGRKLLERLVRTSLITTGSVGRSRIDEQISSIVPYTLLAHKAGFPVAGSRQRGADTFIYQALKEQLGTEDALREFVKKVFGRGVIVRSISELGGNYDGQTPLDTLTRLSIAFLDGFQNTRPGITRERNIPSPCPALTQELAVDLLSYLEEYHASMPTEAFTHHLLILMNFELFTYTLKLVHAINALVQRSDTLPAAMVDAPGTTPPQLYLDFTESTSGYSQEMAKACVRRDIETYQQFLWSNLLLRQLDSYLGKLKNNPRYKTLIENAFQPELTGAQYLQSLLQLKNDPVVSLNIEAAAIFDEDRIRKENTIEGEEDDPAALGWIDAIVETATDNVDRVVNLLVEGQREDAVKHFIQWYWGVGGMKKPQGVMRGTTLNRKSWRYAPTNDVLAVFVQLAASRLSSPNSLGSDEQGAQPIRLQRFLQFLEQHFGILVDRPPATFEGAEYAAAARENLRAMLRRLRQMGIFRDLSDDFTVQRLHPPYAGRAMKGIET